MAFVQRHSRALFISIFATLVIVAAGLLIAKVSFAGLEWEPQKPPEVYQNNSSIDFYKVDFQQNPSDNKYYGWVVGEDLSGKQSSLLYFNGAFWKSITDDGLGAGSTSDLFDVSAVWNSDIDQYLVWAVGENQALWYLTDSETVCNSEAIPCPDSPAGAVTLNSVEGAWYSGDDKVAFFVGDNGHIYHAVADDYQSAFAYTAAFATSGTIRDIDSFDAAHTWAVSSDGKIYFNSDYLTNSWVQQASFPGIDFTGVSAADASHVWASAINGTKGQIYFYDGSTWSLQFTTVLDIPLHDVSAFYNPTLSIYNAFAVGDIDSSTGNGGVYQYNGTIWERQDSNNNGEVLRGISAASLIEIRAVGANTTLLTSSPGNIFGWIWLGSSTSNGSGDALGWGSGSCANLDSCESAGFTYGVNIRRSGTSQGALSGYFWLGNADPDAYIPNDCDTDPGVEACQSNSSISCTTDFECRCAINSAACFSTGWMSFNKKGSDGVTDEAGTPPAAPYNDGAQNYIARFDAKTGKVTGWARLLSLYEDPSTGGWIRLRGNAVTPNVGDLPVRDCKNCGKFCSLDTTYKCTVDADCNVDADGDGTDENYGPCNVSVCKICNALNDETIVSANMCSNTGGTSCTRRCELNNSITCTDDADCIGFGSCVNETFCDSCVTYDQYGVAIDDATGKITGYAWSGASTTYGQLGWIDFNRANYYSQAWLQTQFGNIYAQADIGSVGTPAAPEGKCNATYVISAAGTITNFCSRYEEIDPTAPPGDYTTRPFIQQNYDEIYYPTEANNYTNVLGKLDPDALVQDVGAGKNKYGDEIITVNSDADLLDLGLCDADGVTLDGKVYHVVGNLSIGVCNPGSGDVTELIIKNSSLASGSGTIVVDGNLTIDMNISYEQSSISNIRDLASLGVMVKKNMIVTGDVDSIVGSYIVFGTDETEANKFSGIKIENSLIERSFSAQGLMIARGFKFERTYRGTLIDPQPAEQVVYDGRVIANTPPGFRDFAKVLPVIRETIPF
ncbi:MAG: hypothetical protein H6760_00885 [Candidatus Nomurabacteria bacterium]|nr:MAG: hypothetical protein H6760_00885 [Candidatus Nomurabacteria bacterium]